MIEAIIGHLVGDYLVQNQWMAVGKKKSSFICAIHCLVWTFMVCIFSGTIGVLGSIILFVTHFAQDRTNIISHYMTFVGQADFRDGPCKPWSSIVVDNVWHIVVIYLVIKFGL